MLFDPPSLVPGTVIHVSVNGAIIHFVTSQEPAIHFRSPLFLHPSRLLIGPSWRFHIDPHLLSSASTLTTLIQTSYVLPRLFINYPTNFHTYPFKLVSQEATQKYPI